MIRRQRDVMQCAVALTILVSLSNGVAASQCETGKVPVGGLCTEWYYILMAAGLIALAIAVTICLICCFCECCVAFRSCCKCLSCMICCCRKKAK